LEDKILFLDKNAQKYDFEKKKKMMSKKD